ncbi:hypothetical protein IV203_028761 [Nitzschia inconspicua]|uniref:Uncharacterized protein n=1 Tax=Nitzschia inconspicua TaxID=303405 RepID=A0A9K3LT34_9STRA|nr:hypothetical protein IV203_028761 [Nitzschia inconspicua]
MVHVQRILLVCSTGTIIWSWIVSFVVVPVRADRNDEHPINDDVLIAPSSAERRRRLTDDIISSQKRQQSEHDLSLLDKVHEEHLSPFTISESIVTLGPTVFPKPTHIFENESDIVTYIQPIHGNHRPESDAIFLFAAEYALQNYLVFLTTLRDTGYDGDVVMAISAMDWAKDDVKEYLQNDPHVIIYIVQYECYNAEGEAVESAKGGIRVCKQDHLFGRRKSGDGTIVEPLPDPRHLRTLQNSRYELYWIWSEKYHAYSWIMLIDARDTFFQRNPFDWVPRRQKHFDDAGGILLFFGENVDATRLGKSAHNRDWLTKAYGLHVAEALIDKPTICSGSTMGEQVAIEMYLRAMVMESDETRTVKMGADQGFHNRLYYSNKLANAKAIQKIIVQDQGYGIVNNLGALRTKPLDQWGNGKLLDIERATIDGVETNPDNVVKNMIVRNWDGRVSPVVHQFDRHTEFSNLYFKKKWREIRQRWDASKKLQAEKR